MNVGENDTIALTFEQTYSEGGVEVDWQDGSEVESKSGLYVSMDHTFEEAGEHIIKITCKSGSWVPGQSGTRFVYPADRLTDIDFAYDVTTFRPGAFEYCTGLIDIKLSRYVTALPDYVFAFCTNLRSINKTANSDVNLPVSLKTIGREAFRACSSLSGKMALPKNLQSISMQAFQDCSGLTMVSLGDSVDYIGNAAFWQCTSLEEFEFNSALTSISIQMFQGCSSLKQIDIPETISSIGVRAFNYCTSLEKVIVRNPNLNITAESSSDLAAGLFIGDGLLETAGPIGGSYNVEFAFTDKIPAGFLKGNEDANLKSVVLPSTIVEIGEQAFRYQTKLYDITLPYGVQKIGTEAFYHCNVLGNGSFTIPGTVNYIGYRVFAYTFSLTELRICTTTLGSRDICPRPSRIDDSWVYEGNTDLKIHLRESLSYPKYLEEFGSTDNIETSVAYFAALNTSGQSAEIICDLNDVI